MSTAPTITLGREAGRDCQAPLSVYRYTLQDGVETGYVRREKYRTHKEIYRDIHKRMDVVVCKCGHEWKPRVFDDPCPKCKDQDIDNRTYLVDEYDTTCTFGADEDNPILTNDCEVQSIMCFSEVGGNEGYSVYAAVWARREREQLIVPIYRIKSFLGMEHCNMLVERLQKVLGVWPLWQMNEEDKKKFAA